MVYGELGAYPMSVYVEHRMVSFWSNIVNSSDSKLTNILYRYIYKLIVDGGFTFEWLICIKNILNKYGFSNIWLNQSNYSFNPKWLKLSIKQRIFDQFQQTWKSEMENSPKALCYKLFKENFEFEEYLDLLPYKDRITLCKFRSGNHRLPIETGRWRRIIRQERYCVLCNSQEIGDEFHYILNCTALTESRRALLKPYYVSRVNVLKFGTLFISKNIRVLKNLCKLIRIINIEVCSPG